jgi:hypothetical protein
VGIEFKGILPMMLIKQKIMNNINSRNLATGEEIIELSTNLINVFKDLKREAELKKS